MEQRKQKEAEFHNRRENMRINNSEDYQKITSNKKFYSITRKSHDFVTSWLKKECKNKTCLDYCCGTGDQTVAMAQWANMGFGIDISESSINTCKQKAEQMQIGHKFKFLVMDAEAMSFDDESFDVILCSGVLHHLDTSAAFSELARVLKPDGKILCVEALGYNPLINWYRRRTPTLRTEWETDHILTFNDLKKATEFFGGLEVHFYHLASIAAVPFRNMRIFTPVLICLEMIDEVLLRIPVIQKHAWQMVFILSKPKA